MNGDLVVRVVIQAFNDIDLPSRWPIGTLGIQSGSEIHILGKKHTITPECWPCSTPGGHVYSIQDNEPARVGKLRRNPDALSVPGDSGRCFHSHDSVPGRVDLDQALRLLGKTMRRDRGHIQHRDLQPSLDLHIARSRMSRYPPRW